MRCIQRLAAYDLKFSTSLHDLWIEYQAQDSVESRWVKVLDRLIPFIVNLGSQGQRSAAADSAVVYAWTGSLGDPRHHHSS
jgi:hypothetical protein